MQVSVRDNNVDQALRALKKKLQREGVFREMKLRQHFEKPSEKRAREKAEAIRVYGTARRPPRLRPGVFRFWVATKKLITRRARKAGSTERSLGLAQPDGNNDKKRSHDL